ncbi:MAG: serine/threonine protein kinase [Kiritimatiellia bacterium]
MSNYNGLSDGAGADRQGMSGVPGADPVPTMNCTGCNILIDTTGVKPFSRIKCPACGAENDVPAKFAHFLLLKRLGAGGMGTVFLAEDVSLGRKVAIKMMQKSVGDDPAALETFRNEAQSAAKLNHPHVAQIYSFGQHRGCPYLEMELVAGNKLDGMISDGIKLDPAFVMRVGLEIAEGLQAAENAGLFHGDIKPDNILFDSKMRAKLVDFGIASLATQGKSNELWGTPYYIAPEKVQKKKNSARSDIYSLGATLYHAIAGEPPYEGDDAVAVIKARFAGPPRPLEEIRPDVDPEVSRIIGRMMYNDLFMRYPNYGSLINDIKNYLAPIPAIRKQGPILGPGITRKTISSTALQTGDMSGAGDASGRGGKKLVIQKGTVEASQAVRALTTASPAIIRPNENASAAMRPAKTSSINGAKIALYSIFALILLSIVGAGAWFGNIVLKRRSASKMVQVNTARAAEFEQKYFDLEAELEGCANKMRLRDQEMTNDIASVVALFERATGDALAVPDLEPPAAPAPLFDAAGFDASAADAAPAEAPAAEAPKPKERDPADIELEIRARLEFQKIGVEQPGKEMLDLMMKKLKQEAAANAEAAAPEPEAAAEPEPEPAPVAEFAEPAPEPEAPLDLPQTPADKLRQLVEVEIFEPAKAIRAAMRRCESILDEPPEVFAEIRVGMSAAQVEAALNTRLQAHESRLKHIEEVNSLVAQADVTLKTMRQGRAKVEREAAKLLEERDRLAREDAAAAAKARVEAERLQREARHQALVQEQVDRVRTVFAGRKEMVDKFEYDKAAADMMRMERELTFPEAQEELKWTVERLNRLSALQAFLIDDIKKNGLIRRAYRNFDIRGVSEDGLELIVPMRRGVVIAELTQADWITLFTFLLERRPHDRPIGTMEHGEHLFNAAIFCYVHSGNHPNALAKAKALAKMAMEKKTSLKHDAEKLIPILAEPDAPAEEGETSEAPAF